MDEQNVVSTYLQGLVCNFKLEKLDGKSSWHFPASRKVAHTLPQHIDKFELYGTFLSFSDYVGKTYEALRWAQQRV